MNRICIAVALLVLCLGCAGPGVRLRKAMDSWIGVEVDSLYATWGLPQNSFTLSDGRTVLEYDDTRIGTALHPIKTEHSGRISTDGGGMDRSYSGTSTTYAHEVSEAWCKRFVVLNSDKKIVELNWQDSMGGCNGLLRGRNLK